MFTSFSFVHTAVLGVTLAEIAGEKAGIIKEGVPVVSAPQKEEALEVLQRIAGKHNSKITLIGKDVIFERLSSSLDGQTLQLSSLIFQPTFFEAHIPLLGFNQIENAAISYAALKASGLEISDEAIQKGFAQVYWPARFEVVRRDPPVILDSAHNKDSFARLRETLDEHFPGKPVYLIFGASEDKNIPGMFAEMKPKLKKLIVTRADHPRALEVEKIVELARQAGVESEAVELQTEKV